jgi:hypothetical protein
VPVQTFPTVRKAGIWIPVWGYASRSTILGITPDSIVEVIYSWLPSLSTLKAQHASLMISGFWEVFRTCVIIGRACLTIWNGGDGRPRIRLDRSQIPLRFRDSLAEFVTFSMIVGITFSYSIESRQKTESPAMFPRAHIAYSRIISISECNAVRIMGRPPLSRTCITCCVYPETTFVIDQAASY